MQFLLWMKLQMSLVTNVSILILMLFKAALINIFFVRGTENLFSQSTFWNWGLANHFLLNNSLITSHEWFLCLGCSLCSSQWFEGAGAQLQKGQKFLCTNQSLDTFKMCWQMWARLLMLALLIKSVKCIGLVTAWHIFGFGSLSLLSPTLFLDKKGKLLGKTHCSVC